MSGHLEEAAGAFNAASEAFGRLAQPPKGGWGLSGTGGGRFRVGRPKTA